MLAKRPCAVAHRLQEIQDQPLEPHRVHGLKAIEEVRFEGTLDELKGAFDFLFRSRSRNKQLRQGQLGVPALSRYGNA
jgi:hypothetical protein